VLRGAAAPGASNKFYRTQQAYKNTNVCQKKYHKKSLKSSSNIKINDISPLFLPKYKTQKLLKITTPGRICLFGEHQDYLGLPVIAAAISCRVGIAGKLQSTQHINIQLPDINSQQSIALNQPIQYTAANDYFRSAIKVLAQRGYTWSQGFDCTISGNIPINSGTSSSSAMICTWVHFLMHMSQQGKVLTAKEIGEIAYLAEVVEFDQAGGMMDQYATAMGHIIYLESEPSLKAEFLQPKLGAFVLGDSLQAKDTQKILRWVKFGMLDIVKKIKEKNKTFNLHTFDSQHITDYKAMLSAPEMHLLAGNLSDRDILRTALAALRKNNLTDTQLGSLLNQHQTNLREAKKISTPKIDLMIDAALDAGALGCKINGSGGGGCMFAYAPTHTHEVAQAIERQGGKAYIIHIDEGTRVEN
jgi:galactokinase